VAYYVRERLKTKLRAVSTTLEAEGAADDL
jgi:hypothetical protein